MFSRVFLLLAQFGPSEKNDPNQDNGGGGGTTNRGEAIWAAARPSETAIDASMDNFVKDVVGGQDGQRLDIDNQTLGAPMQNTSSAETTMVGPVSVEAVRQLFKNYDFDDSGEISFEELKDMLVKMHESSEGKSLTPEQAEFDSTLVMKTLDSDGGGLIGQGKRKTPIATCCLCWYCREDRVLLLLLTLFFFFFFFFWLFPWHHNSGICAVDHGGVAAAAGHSACQCTRLLGRKSVANLFVLGGNISIAFDGGRAECVCQEIFFYFDVFAIPFVV